MRFRASSDRYQGPSQSVPKSCRKSAWLSYWSYCSSCSRVAGVGGVLSLLWFRRPDATNAYRDHVPRETPPCELLGNRNSPPPWLSLEDGWDICALFAGASHNRVKLVAASGAFGPFAYFSRLREPSVLAPFCQAAACGMLQVHRVLATNPLEV